MSRETTLLSPPPILTATRRTSGSPPQIYDVFPEVRRARVEVIETGVGLSLHKPAQRLALDGAAHVPCSNPYCVGGGLLLLPHIEEMVARREVEHEVKAFCGGAEFFHNVPLGPRCPNAFQLSIHLEFE